jgi:hypothetical protein
VDPNGHTATVTVTRKSGNNATLFPSSALSGGVSSPQKISVRTSWYLKDTDVYTVSIKVAGQEVATTSGNTVSTFLEDGKELSLRAQSVGTVQTVIPGAGAGIPLVAPNGTVYFVTVSNAGALVVNTA